MVEYVWILVVLAVPALLGIVIAARQWMAVRSGTQVQRREAQRRNNR